MKNADMPAMPVVVPHELACDPQSGLTKREIMAMHAPEMPDWFNREWSRSNEGDDRYFYESLSDYDPTYQTFFIEMTPAGHSAMYFAWRTHYADELLTELDRTSK